MRTLGAAVLALGLVAGVAPVQAAGKAAKGGGNTTTAEVNKLKVVRLGDAAAGLFKWGDSPDQVVAALRSAIEARYQPRMKEATADPGMQQRIRGEMNREMDNVTKSVTKFDGQKTGWDVSIIGPEFQQNTGEAVVLIKEEIWTRYFFFFENGLYKIFLSFNKDAIEGKTFADFGKEMQAKFGKSHEVYRDEKMKNGVRRFLDHYEWTAGPDRLKLVDRSEFYGVFCLVLYDAKINERVIAKRKIVNPQRSAHDALVEAATQKELNDRDANDNIIDRITGKEVKKPGEESHGDIVVPSPSQSSTTPPPAKEAAPAAEPAPVPAPAAAPPPAKSAKNGKASKRSNPLDGLDL
ncbi:MAG TPA: hypothetical protein VH374_25595 [Polyangia bacterium]|jgi:hypothetical protein|nr:hypothetical protein [Polyangia bacterium]